MVDRQRSTDASAATAQRRLWRHQRWLQVAAIGSATGLTLAGVATWNYQPITAGSTGRHLGVHRVISSPGVPAAQVFRFEPGASTSVGFSITNRGSRTVRITGVPQGESRSYLFDRVELRVGDGGDNELRGGSPKGLIPFEPFDLHPGTQRFIEVQGRFASDCDVAPIPADADPAKFHAGLSWRDQVVNYEFGRIKHQTRIEMHDTIAVETGGDFVCPDRRGTPTSQRQP